MFGRSKVKGHQLKSTPMLLSSMFITLGNALNIFLHVLLIFKLHLFITLQFMDILCIYPHLLL